MHHRLRSSASNTPAGRPGVRTAVGAILFGAGSTLVWVLAESTPLDQWQQLGIFAVSAAAWLTSAWSLNP